MDGEGLEVKVVEIKPGLSICMDFSDKELQSIIDLIECYFDEYPQNNHICLELLERFKKVKLACDEINSLKDELSKLKQNHSIALRALGFSRQQVYELEDKLNASAT